MPINNSVNNQTTSVSHTKTKPLTVKQCYNDFNQYISISQTAAIDWLSIYPVASQVIKNFSQLTPPLLLMNSISWQAAIAVISSAFNNKVPFLALQDYDQQTLFGRLIIENDQLKQFEQGEIFKNSNGCLVLHISPLLVNPNLWFLLKSYLINRKINSNAAVNSDKLKGASPSTLNDLNTKVIIITNRIQLDELAHIDPEYSQVDRLFTELSSEINASKDNIQALQTYFNQLISDCNLRQLSNEAMVLLFQYLSSLCEHQNKILFSPRTVENLLRYAQLLNSESATICAADLQNVIDLQDKSQSLAQNFSDQALIEKQIHIQLMGEKIGQVNGMSVVELMGYPIEFGEVFRISASDMIGDGELIDVERKVELAGNIHAKSMLIVQGFLNHVFTHINNFPLSCNVVFEQSYQESDGDSASLAILLAVTSCYAQRPVTQKLFVTGSLDQQGNVLAIGGINQKIHAITRLFQLKLLSSPVSVIIPKANKINLTLNVQTQQLIKTKMLNIYAIEHCQEAFPIAMNSPFSEIIEAINSRVDEVHKDNDAEDHDNLITRLLSVFK